MASMEIVVYGHSKQVENVGRFVYDVLVYTLRKYGLHETEIPKTNLKENIYGFTKFIERLGVCVLEISLRLRDRLKQIFESRRKNVGIRNEDISRFLQVVISCCVDKPAPLLDLVIIKLAVCKEFILYCRSHQVSFDLNIVIATITKVIVLFAKMHQNILDTIEELVNREKFSSEYTDFIINFVSKYDVPFGSTEHITKLFIEEDEAFRSNFQEEKQSTGLSTLTASSETTAVGVENSNAICSNISVEAVQLSQNYDEPSELALENDFRRMHLDNERTSHERQGAIPKKRKSRKNKKKR